MDEPVGSKARMRRAGSMNCQPAIAVASAMAATLAAIILALTAGAGPAGAVVVQIGGRGYGITPINGVNPASLRGALRVPGVSGIVGAGSANGFDEGGRLTYLGGPVMHTNTAHVIYWDPNKEFKTTTKEIVNKFFTGVAHDSGSATNVFGVDAQYTDDAGNAAYLSTFGGAVADTDPYPASGCTAPSSGDPGPPYTECLMDEQLQHELSTYIAKKRLPTGLTQLYFLLLPHRVVTCFPGEECSSNVFCAYHSSIEPGTAGEIIYADIPFSLLDTEEEAFTVADAKACQFDGNVGIQQPNPDSEGGKNRETRFADVALKYVSHEFSEAITDPLVGAEPAWLDAHGDEIGDKCNTTGAGIGADANAFLPTLGGSAGTDNLFNQSINSSDFYLQSEWDNATGACLLRPAALSDASFNTTPAPGVAGIPVNFNGSAVDPYGELEFAWTFGDGGTGTDSSPAHTYAAPGEYPVTMTIRDRLTGSTAAPIEHTITIEDRPAAAFTILPNPATAGASVSFNGSASSDPGGDSIESYAWNFGDGTTGAGTRPNHTYRLAGTYTVTLTVTNTANETDAVSQQLAVAAPGAPEAPHVPPRIGREVSATTTAGALLAPDSSFGPIAAAASARTGAITFTESVRNPGKFSWLVTFQNGQFGAFMSISAKCGSGLTRLNGSCRPARIIFARGSRTAKAAGRVIFTLRPSASAMKALRNALRRKRGLPVTITLTFQSSLGGSPVSHTQSLTVRLKRGR